VLCLLENRSSSPQTFHETIKQEIKINFYNIALDNMKNGLNERFSQKTLSVISSVGHILQLNPKNEDIELINKIFKIDTLHLKSEIKLFKGFTDIPSGSSTTTIDYWLDYNYNYNY
jgi:hypothetical protein